MTKCNRCHKETDITIMSKFNTDIICMDCKKKEREHPNYAAADKAECEAVVAGVRNFPGIGKPSDL